MVEKPTKSRCSQHDGGKRLVLINDSQRYAGEVGKLKNLTGQNTLPYEVKSKQSKGGFNPDALVIVTTNEVIRSCDYTSELARRIYIPMFNKIEGDAFLLSKLNGRKAHSSPHLRL